MKKVYLLFIWLTCVCVSSMRATVYSGNCGADGDNLKWTLDTGTGILEISGTGEMESYSAYIYDKAPWYQYENGYKTVIKTIILSEGITSIGNYAFYGCSGPASVEIPNSVISIGEHAFDGCSGLTSMEIPDAVTFIGNYAFYNCSKLTSINVNTNNPYFSSVDGVLFNKSQTELLCMPQGIQGTYKIPNSVTNIGDGAFYSCGRLTSVEIPNSVISIGEHAFANCGGLTSVEIPNSVTSIEDYAFYLCSGLTSVEIPYSVTSVGQYAFYNCSKLTSINVNTNNPYFSSVDGVLFNKSQTELLCMPQGIQGSFKIPNSVTHIENYTFNGCSGLTSVEIPNSVTSIGYYAFSDCSGLTSVEIPNSVTYIGQYAFSGCSGLTSVEIPNSVTSIGDHAFYECI